MEEIQLFKPHVLAGLSRGKEGKARPRAGTTKKVYKLSSNENLLGTSPKAKNAIISGIQGLNEYPDLTAQRLKKALSKFYNGELDPEHFFCCNSGTGVLELIVTGFLDKGQECIYSGATFEPLTLFSNKLGAKSINVPLKDDTFELDVDRILEAITEKTRVIWLCSPNNPTGTHISKKHLDTLINTIPDHVVVVLDEVYFHFANARDYTIALPYVLENKKVIGVNSFSKVYGLAGMRIGYGYTTKSLSNYLNKAIRPFLLDSLSLEAAIAALEDTDFVLKSISTIVEGKKFIYEELEKLNLRYWKSQTNFVLIQVHMDNAELEKKLFELGIMIRPIHSFSTNDYIRVTLGTMESNEAFIEALKIALTQEENLIV